MATAVQEITAEAEQAGVRVWLHACSVRSSVELAIGADEPVVMASVFKIPVALEVARQGAVGRLDLNRLVRISPSELTPSPCGLATLRDPITLSVHDLAVLMLSLSDNAATDLLLELVGRASVDRLLDRLGLISTAVPQNCSEIIRSVGEDLGVVYADTEDALIGADIATLRRLRALDPAQTCRTTPREMSALLRAIWRDEAAPPPVCRQVRKWLSHQAWGNRLASGFDDAVNVASKTGTLPGLRNEAGVVTYPDGGSYAVSVFTRDDDFQARCTYRDHFIGRAARHAVEELRRAEEISSTYA